MMREVVQQQENQWINFRQRPSLLLEEERKWEIGQEMVVLVQPHSQALCVCHLGVRNSCGLDEHASPGNKASAHVLALLPMGAGEGRT